MSNLLAVVDRVPTPTIGEPARWSVRIHVRVGRLTERPLEGDEHGSEHATKRAAINWGYDMLRRRGVPIAEIHIRVIPVGG